MQVTYRLIQMKIDNSFSGALLGLQNGVNNARKAAESVLESVGSEKLEEVEIVSDVKTADGNKSRKLDVSA